MAQLPDLGEFLNAVAAEGYDDAVLAMLGIQDRRGPDRRTGHAVGAHPIHAGPQEVYQVRENFFKEHFFRREVFSKNTFFTEKYKSRTMVSAGLPHNGLCSRPAQ